MEDTAQGICWRLKFCGSVMADMTEASKKARDQMFHLISELMEARMQSMDALRRLQSTMKAMQQLRAGSWPGRDAAKLNEQFPSIS